MDTKRIKTEDLKNFCASVFKTEGVGEKDAEIAVDVLVTADMCGIPSHGVARLGRYINGLKEGMMLPDGDLSVIRESPVSLLVDARGSLGAPISKKTMQSVIDKAKLSGMAFGVVKNSNHFGMAGYYARMALEHDMIGFAMTNTAALGVPTFGKEVMFGTNPLAFAAPAGQEKPFVLDMSTTAVTRGKIELYEREKKDLEPGWAVDSKGKTAVNPESLLEDMFHRMGGGLVPLGGDSECHGGHKGYGMAVMVDILTGLISGSDWGSHIYDKGTSSARVSHSFGAVRIDLFTDPVQFKKDMDSMLKELRETAPAEGAERVYYAGLKEQEAYEASTLAGVPLSEVVRASLSQLGNENGIPFSLPT